MLSCPCFFFSCYYFVKIRSTENSMRVLDTRGGYVRFGWKLVAYISCLLFPMMLLFSLPLSSLYVSILSLPLSSLYASLFSLPLSSLYVSLLSLPLSSLYVSILSLPLSSLYVSILSLPLSSLYASLLSLPLLLFMFLFSLFPFFSLCSHKRLQTSADN